MARSPGSADRHGGPSGLATPNHRTHAPPPAFTPDLGPKRAGYPGQENGVNEGI